MDDSRQQPLLLSENDEYLHHVTSNNNGSFTATFVQNAGDVPPITGFAVFYREFWKEFVKLWYLAGPAIFTAIAQYSLGAITQVFCGHVSTTALAAFTVENSVIAGFAFGFMMGMGSALETLCGQAFGAGQLDMLGIYMQRSWVILISSACILSLLYIFGTAILKLIGETQAISEAAGTLAVWMIPQLFAYALNFPMAKFLQAQSKIMVMASITAAALVVHTIFSWLLMFKLKWGLVGAAVALNVSWWLIVSSQFLNIVSGTFEQAWNEFSMRAFHNLWSFIKWSLASAVMLCLEVWYYMPIVLIAGYLKNAEVSVDALSVCTNILVWIMMISLGMNIAVSVRVSNELGAGHPRAAKLSIPVAVLSSFTVGVIFAAILLITRNSYPALFSNDPEVQHVVKQLTPLLCFSLVVNNIQPVLSGVAIGAGWQAFVAYVNVGCYYVLGVPLGLILGFKLHLGITGIWLGMMSGTIVQTCILILMVYKTNWDKEASIAEDRIKKWGGKIDSNRANEH